MSHFKKAVEMMELAFSELVNAACSRVLDGVENRLTKLENDASPSTFDEERISEIVEKLMDEPDEIINVRIQRWFDSNFDIDDHIDLDYILDDKIEDQVSTAMDDADFTGAMEEALDNVSIEDHINVEDVVKNALKEIFSNL